MNLQRLRLSGILLLCIAGFGLVGGLLGWALHKTPTLAAATLGLVVVGSLLAAWKWWASDNLADIKRWLGYRWRRVKRLPLRILGVLIAMAIVSSVAGFRRTEQPWKGLWQNLGPELAGAVVTYVLLDLVLGTRQRKVDLIAKMGSNARDVAIPAAEQLRVEGWLTDGSLKGAPLWSANLAGAELWGAELEEAELVRANLAGVNLVGANLQKAVLVRASLRKARLEGAALWRACLKWADLRLAVLHEAHLEDVDLTEAVVATSALLRARTLAGATLPDGTKLSDDNWQAEFEEWCKKQEERPEAERDNSDG